MNLVVEALDGPRVVPVAFEDRGGRVIGLLDPANDLVVELLLEHPRRLHDEVGIFVLGDEMGNDFRVGSLP